MKLRKFLGFGLALVMMFSSLNVGFAETVGEVAEGIVEDVVASDSAIKLQENGVIALAEANVEFAGGDGTEGNPYQIDSIEKFVGINDYLDAHYILTNDIDFSSINNWEPLASKDKPFRGTLDGNGYKLCNLNIVNEEYASIFAVTDGATFDNLNIENINIQSKDADSKSSVCMGSIIGLNVNNPVIIRNCNITGEINFNIAVSKVGMCIGGYIGSSETDVYIENSDIELSVSSDVEYGISPGTVCLGGIIGDGKTITANKINISGNILLGLGTDSNQKGRVYLGGLAGYCDITANEVNVRADLKGDTNKVSGEMITGGLVGSGRFDIENCSVEGDITNYSYNSQIGYAGGLVGSGSGQIKNSHYIGYLSNYALIIYAKARAGGLVGSSEYYGGSCTIENSYANANIYNRGYWSSINCTGGLIGYANSAIIKNSSAEGEYTSTAYEGGRSY